VAIYLLKAYGLEVFFSWSVIPLRFQWSLEKIHRSNWMKIGHCRM